MAQAYTNNDGITLINPGTYVSVNVRSGQGNIAQAGVVTLIGEADEGPSFDQESDLNLIAYTPDQLGEVIAKFGSGRLVDAFRAIVAAASDPAIVGAVSLVRMVKTNPSQAAQDSISRNGFGNFATIQAKRAGLPGNLIKYRSDIAVPESAPAFSQLSYAPHYGASSIQVDFRANGQNANSVTIAAKASLSALAGAIENAADGIGVMAQDEVLPVQAKAGATLSATSPAAGMLQISLSAGYTFDGNPTAGDTIVIPANGDFGATADSIVSNTGANNIGSYIIVSVTNTLSSASMTLKKMNAPTGMTLSSASGTILSGQRDIILYKPISIENMTGMNRQSTVGLSGLFTSTVNGLNITMQAPASWSAQPKAGDMLEFQSTFADVAEGFYLVISSTANSVVAAKLSQGTAGTSGSQTIASPIPAGSEPFMVLKPVIDGLGKSLETHNIAGMLSSVLKNGDGSDADVDDKFLTSGAEYVNSFTISRQTTSDTFKSGGSIVMSIGCNKNNASVIVGPNDIKGRVGSSDDWTASYSQFKILNDLISFINSQTGWSASLGSSRFSNTAPSALDEGQFGASSDIDAKPARLKKDAVDWATNTSGSGLASTALQAFSGLPEVISPDKMLSSGAKTGTTSAQVIAAIDAVEQLETNFMVPLFSMDASDDMISGDTESSSTYSIDAINAYAKAHVIKMSALKMRKNRMALVSKSDSYTNIKETAGELSSFRVGLCFQNIKNTSIDGTIKTFQPWMGSVIAAGMQSAAGYKGIVKKFANITGVLTPENDFNPSNPGETEDALKAGLLVLERVPTGGFRWISDQLTYSADNNFVYNSLQAVYLADLMTLTLIQLFDRTVVGRSVAEISAAAGLSILEAQMFDFLRLRWIAPSDDAPKGYKNAVVKINGGVMEISVEAKLAGLIYFVPISLTVSQIQQTAG